ncbi:MAG: glutamate synthase [Candidatus Aminicenantes bacterium]|jgi:glutamate synthase domain-containing protein 1/glutamate synthase domain-containing protein 3
MKTEDIRRLLDSREKLSPPAHYSHKQAMEGGCGVVGLACDEQISGRHIMQSLIQMHNRGNSKGGGIAVFGLNPEQLGVSQKILEEDYMIQVAFLDPETRKDVEKEFIYSSLEVHSHHRLPTVNDFRDVSGLDVQPPEVWRYFCRVKEDVLSHFILIHDLETLEREKAEDEFIYQNTYELNKKFYSALGEKKAFVLSHGRNMLILKIVGYAEQVIQYYQLGNLDAHVWIGHQRYPTKGKVWHPGGAHPFMGMNEALVHNGDFANYHSIAEYLSQRNIYPLFLTDTEVSVLLFDLFNRVYEYPLEYTIEALAPTTERDFHLLPEEKRKIYRAIQASHIHSSPDGPWFFIIGQTDRKENSFKLFGITDTSMLRPQVFAFQENGVNIGLVASEKQAIDATLRSLHKEDERFLPYADFYWNARGGSYTDGGAFVFTVKEGKLTITDKFGRKISTEKEKDCPSVNLSTRTPQDKELSEKVKEFTGIIDRRWRVPMKDRARVLTQAEKYLNEIFLSLPDREQDTIRLHLTDWSQKDSLSPPQTEQEALVVNCEKFPSEGGQSISRFIVKANQLGWKNFITFNWRGQRFCGCGLGPDSEDVRIDVFGSSGDYLGSGLDGVEIAVHENAQDQVGQIMKSGKLVVYGDVGQTFMYGAKGGEAYVLGNAAGRPLINAVGTPRVVINGTCLDYLAESFMAGDPLEGGGFVILNGLKFNTKGEIIELDTPYPGGNLFSLASGGSIYIRDPHLKVEPGQLNGGQFADVTEKDWEVILPSLKENENLFDISVERLLSVDGKVLSYNKVYRKVEAVELKILLGTHY